MFWRITCLALALLLPVAPAAWGDMPDSMHYHAFLTDDQGAPLEGAYNITFSLYNQETEGSALWTETLNVTLSGGSLHAVLGATNPLDANVFQGDTALWLGIAVGADPEMSPRQEIGSVPYAARAQWAASAASVPADAIVDALTADGRFATKEELTDLNPLTAPVNWQDLTGIPEGFADGEDAVRTDAEILALLLGQGYLTAADLANYVTLSDMETALDEYYTSSEMDILLQGLAPSVHTHVWADLTDVPATCNEGESLRWDMSIHGWACHIASGATYLARENMGVEFSGSAIGLYSYCTDGQVLQWSAALPGWVCATPAGASYTAKANMGLEFDGSEVGLLSGCADGSVLKWDESIPAWACSLDTGITAESDPSVNELGKATLACAAGETVKWNGTAWACAPDTGIAAEADPSVNELGKATLACAAGETVKWNGTAWACAPDTGIAAETDPSVNELGKATLACAAGETVKWNGTAWACAPDTGITAETDPSVNELGKAALACASGQVPRWNGLEWVCAAVSDTLGSLSCLPGQIARRDTDGWFCDDEEVSAADMTAHANDASAHHTRYSDAEAANAVEVKMSLVGCGGTGVAVYSEFGWVCSEQLSLLGCAAGAVAVYNGSSWNCRTDWVSDTELASYAITNVDGLEGGTITGDVVVAGTLSATELRQNGNVVCDESGNCGQTLSDVSCTANQILRFNGADWECANETSVPAPPVCNGANEALQWDGTAWACVNVRNIGASAGLANGYEVLDNWGETWDGRERAQTTWANANADCIAKGGRLPTATELFRNNATTGTGSIATAADSAYLWTLIGTAAATATRVTVRLSDGAIGSTVETGSIPYRCVWPNRTSDTFNGDYCYGPAGSECASVRRFYNMDKMDRPALDFVAASHECNFYNASLPTLEDWHEIIHSQSVPESGANYLWSADLTTSSNTVPIHAAVRFTTDAMMYWSYTTTGTMATFYGPTTATRFRCIGKRSASEGVSPTPVCEGGGCFVVQPSTDQSPDHSGRRAPIWADKADRAADTRAQAFETCRGLGGSLPTLIEFQELVHAGWDNGTNAYLWLGSSAYTGTYWNPLARWSGTGAKNWYAVATTTITYNAGTAANAYRCVWHQQYQADPISCDAGEAPQWDGQDFTCVAIENGDAEGQGNTGVWADSYGNDWDRDDRTAATFAEAAATCEGLGARLPTITEVYRVRAGGPNTISYTKTVYWWTILPSYQTGYQATIRTSDGSMSQSLQTGSLTYRCIWPATTTNVFSGKACNDPEKEGGCFANGRVVSDRNNRAFAYGATAVHECLFYGGWVSGLRDFESNVHAGWPNGETSYNWIAEPVTNNNFAVGRWYIGSGSTTGTPAWYWTSSGTTTGTNAVTNSTVTSFRCVFHDYLR